MTILATAPKVVGIGASDDGWLCASLWVSGRRPVWVNDSDPTQAEQFLHRMGLPPLSQDEPEAIVGADLTLDRKTHPATGPLPKPSETKPLVSILICTYNRAHLLNEAIESALLQSWPTEIMVVNDGSTDETRAMLDDMDGIRVIHQENGGKPKALDTGLAAIRGDAVLVLDDDDCLTPGALHVLGQALFSDDSLSCVIADTMVFKDNTENPTKYIPALRIPACTAQAAILQQMPGLPGASLIRMSSQRAAGGYDASLIRGQDMDMYLRLSQVGGIEALPLPTFWYRSHDELRGSATGQWKKSDPATHMKRFMSCVTPVFVRRFETASPIQSRFLSYAWALGLHLRQRKDLALTELARWPAPHSPREQWIREQLGLDSILREYDEGLLVIDDGDPGSLESTLAAHATDRSVWVNLEVPREPLGDVRLFWQGEYTVRDKLSEWYQGPYPVHIRLSSAPEWSPPPLMSRCWLPDLDAISAILATAAALDWPTPTVTRPGLHASVHPLVQNIQTARAAIQSKDAKASLRATLPILKALPTWPGSWRLVGEAFQLHGDSSRAQTWFDRIDTLQAG
jgi:hypothetical protein